MARDYKKVKRTIKDMFEGLIENDEPNYKEINKRVRFFDYDGTLLYTYGQADIDKMRSLPEGVDHSGEGLTFQGWNWTLEDIKEEIKINRVDVGAMYITSDGWTKIKITDITYGSSESSYGVKVQFSKGTEVSYVNKEGIITDVTMGNFFYIDLDYGTSEIELKFKFHNDGYLNGVSVNNVQSYKIDNIMLGEHVKNIPVPQCTLDNLKFINMTTYVDRLKYSDDDKFVSRKFPKLKYITISPNVTTLYKGQFSGSLFLENISLPKSLTTIKEYAFENCYRLKEIAIPSSVTTTESCIFNRCEGLNEIIVASDWLTIATFKNCYNLENVEFGNGVTTIGNNVFDNCVSLRKIVLPNNITSTNDSTFINCINLKYVKFGNGLSKLSKYMFKGCTALDNVELPDTITW